MNSVKKLISVSFIFALIFQIQLAFAQNEFTKEPAVPNDPLKAHIYTLKNGLKVYLSVYKDAPRIQTFIAVKAGSKNDPSNATGLAHYLEHILFKGTSKFGTSDWEKEKVLLSKIEDLFEIYRQTTDLAKRKAIYHEIDSISNLAAKYAIANEYDKMLASIGAEGTNAYTSLEQTVYVNEIPSNQVDKWAQIESNRMSEVVPRLFHTELEAVYEEKNKGLDNDSRKVWASLMEGLFQKNTYGTQTTIGTVEHLKNPSIKEIKKYFDTYYVPNNMAICMSGDFNPDETIKIIAKYFGNWKSKNIPQYNPAKEDAISKPIIKNVLGPNAESVNIAFRFPGTKSTDAKKLELLSTLLSNSQAGIIDINLNQNQKTLGAYASSLRFNDYSALLLGGQPKEGQSLDEVKDLLLSQLEEIKKGNFDDWLIPAVINDYKISQLKEYESIKKRADAFVSAFISNTPWQDYISEIDELSKISKKDIIEFTKQNFNSNNYVIVYKRIGLDSTIKKVEKPKITPVSVNRESNSPFYQTIMEQKSDIINPVFIDYKKAIIQKQLKSTQLNYVKNNENEIFNTYFVLDIGSNDNPKLSLATQYLSYLGSQKYNAVDLKKEFYKLGCTYEIITAEDKMYVSLSGLNKNFKKALTLLEDLIKSPAENPEALKELIQDILKSRANAKLNKNVILTKGLLSYAKYGPKSPFTNILSKEELNKITSKELIDMIQKIFLTEHKILYYGPEDLESLAKTLTENHQLASSTNIIEKKNFTELDINENEVYWVNYDMVQAEMILLSKSFQYNPDKLPVISLFNEYFGGGMSSIVFQEMRESKALAYQVRSTYNLAKEKEKSNYMVSYIGTQADKLKESLAGMEELLNSLPKAETNFNNAKDAILKTIETERITKSEILFSYERLQKLGQENDIRKNIYENVTKLKFEDIENFQKEYVKNQKQKILIIGSKDKLDFETLQKYGKVKELTLEEIFGY